MLDGGTNEDVISGVSGLQITGASGLKVGQDVIELKQNTPDGKYLTKVLPVSLKPGELTLTRDHSNDDSFTRLVEMARVGRIGAVSGALIVYDSRGNMVERYRISNAVPKSAEVDAAVLTEKLILTYETIEVER